MLVKLFWMCVTVMLIAGCRRHDTQTANDFAVLSAGCDLVWVTDRNNVAVIRDGKSPDATPAQKPEELNVNLAYGLGCNKKWTNEDIALRVMPERIKNIGGRIIGGPSSRMDLTRGYVGGPYFQIEFELDGQRWFLRTRLAHGPREEATGEHVLILAPQ